MMSPKTTTKSLPLNDSESFTILGRYAVDYGHNWNVVSVQPFKYVVEKCFMCSGTGKDVENKEGDCPICEGRGTEKTPEHDFDINLLADLLEDFLETGDHFEVTIKVSKRDPAHLWDGEFHEGKTGDYLVKNARRAMGS